jgi:hypothetical protein
MSEPAKFPQTRNGSRRSEWAVARGLIELHLITASRQRASKDIGFLRISQRESE